MIFEKPPPHIVQINGVVGRVWCKGQPVICDICNKQGHKSAVCSSKDKCRLCGVDDDFSRQCPNPWGTAGEPVNTADGETT